MIGLQKLVSTVPHVLSCFRGSIHSRLYTSNSVELVLKTASVVRTETGSRAMESMRTLECVLLCVRASVYSMFELRHTSVEACSDAPGIILLIEIIVVASICWLQAESVGMLDGFTSNLRIKDISVVIRRV